MKTMTCKQMGGPCDTAMKAMDADSMMMEGAKHVQEMAAQGDEEHKKVLTMMDDMQKNPDSPENKAWTEKFMADFEALPME
jgi:hypothetical protein